VPARQPASDQTRVGLDGLRDEPRSGAPRTIEDARIEAVIVRTLESLPPDATHWSSRGMSRACGLSVSTVQRIWRAFGLQPHRLETFKLSTDPDFVAKVRDVVGLYLAPPAQAIVLCVDEKSQIQALDRSQPMLPMRPGQAARRSHDYTRHGTTSLFAALDIATGRVIGKCFARHRATEFRKFLDAIEANVPRDLDVHLVIEALSRQLWTSGEGARSNQVSCCDGILPLRRRFGSEGPQRGAGDEVALEIERVVDGGMDAKEVLGGSS
jgi:hypothetical protein